MKQLSILVVSVILLFTSSCVKHDESLIGDDESTAQSALNDPFTALGTGDEELQFGDDDVVSVDTEESNVEDEYAPENQEAADEPTTAGCDVYSLLFRWGQLTGVNRDVSGVTHWSGDIHVNVGTLSVIKKVAFDFNDELMPRIDPKVIEFESNTRPHFDGLRIRYEVCDADKALLGEGETPTLTFNASNAPLSKSFAAAELVDLNVLEQNLNANNDRFQALAVKKSDLCQGTLQGRWIQKNANYGVFKGIVVATNGIRVGYVKGFFGQHEKESKWVAKFISHAGHFGGIMKGTYADNNFSGDIYSKTKNEIGSVEGSFVLPSETGDLGTFSANYTLDCDQVPSSDE